MHQKSPCPYCHTNKQSHFLIWYIYSLNILMSRLQRIVLDNCITRFFRDTCNGVYYCYVILSWFKIVTFVDELRSDADSRIRVIWEELHARGWKCMEVRIFKKSITTCIVKMGEKSRWDVWNIVPRPPRYQGHLSLIDDKKYFRTICQRYGLPHARGWCAITFWWAYKIFQSIQKPVIIKPRMWSRGWHVTTYISTKEELRTAFKLAKQLCFWVIVEEQIHGNVYRWTVIDYSLEGLLESSQPYIVGDGVSTIADLILKKNIEKLPQVRENILTDAMRIFLIREIGYLSRKFPEKNIQIPQKDAIDSMVIPFAEKVYLSEKVGILFWGMNGERYGDCHPDTKKMFESAARVFGDPIIWFDSMIPDISRSYRDQRCALIEANTLPFFHLHHIPETGKPRDIAGRICDVMGWK